jgi:hypothetical protein
MKQQYSIEHNGNKIVFDIPSRLKDITLQELTEYEVKFNTFPKWFREFKGDETTLSQNDKASFIHYSLELFSVYTKKDLTVLKEIADLKSILALWNTLHYAMFYTEPKQIKSFKFRNETFIVPQNVINHLTGETENANLNTWETILALQYEFILNDTDLIKQGGNYNRKLAIVSILCRKKDEILPLQDTECVEFVTNRMKYFSNLDAETVENVMFFFTLSLLTSKKIGISSMLLKVLKNGKI